MQVLYFKLAMDLENNEAKEQENSIEHKRQKIQLNYDTITVLKNKLNEDKVQQRIGMTRNAYVKMILDATKKVNCQNEELAKVIMETRKLQRDIGGLSGRLERSFVLVENTIARGSKSDKWCCDCLGLLKSMHENCDQLITAVEDTGEISREIRQLEDQISRTRATRSREGV